MNAKQFINGLAQRNFSNIEKIYDDGECHLDHHYVVMRDGLVFYSTIPHHNEANPDDVKVWCFDDSILNEPFFKEFTFEEFDKLIS